MKRLVAIALATAFLVSANASAQTTISCSTTCSYTYQWWVDHARVATPPGTVAVAENGSLCAPKLACTGPEEPIWFDLTSPIFAVPRSMHEIFDHELGHHFDYTVMQDWARERFEALVGDYRPWTEDPNAPNEKFAEAWASCAMRGPILHGPVDTWGYDYRPTRLLQRKACHLIEVAALSH